MKRIHCQEPWFSKIKQGLKTVEGRKFSAKYASLHPGEIIEMHCDTGSFLVEVLKVITYKSVEEYLHSEGFDRVLPGIASFEHALEVYLQYNSRDELKTAGGFLALHLKLLD